MDEARKKQVKIGVIVVCFAIALIITIANMGGGNSRKPSNGPVQMLCSNPDCGHSFELSRDEWRKNMQGPGMGPMGPMMLGQMPAVSCPKCSKDSAVRAAKCKECGEVFPYDYSAKNRFPDRCPKCGYSDIEERRRK